MKQIVGAGAEVAGEKALPKLDPKQLTTAKAAKVVADGIAAKLLVQNQLVNAAALKNANGVKPGDSSPVAALAGEAALGIPEEHEFEVESLDVKSAAPKEAASKLSTQDYLNLREISQVGAKPNLLNPAAVTDAGKPMMPVQAANVVVGKQATQKQKPNQKQNLSDAMSALAPAHAANQTFGKTMDAIVTQTAGQKPVLSPESVSQIGNQVNLLGQARQDGEIKIRLRPDHLGELQMSVRTEGKNVSVMIKAENDEAKRIIEGSLGALRDHLSQQNLSLARIDVVTQPAMSSSLDQTQMRFDSQQNFNQSTQQGWNQGSADGSPQTGREFSVESSRQAQAPAATPIRSRVNDLSRLDMIA